MGGGEGRREDWGSNVGARAWALGVQVQAINCQFVIETFLSLSFISQSAICG